jgi:NAD(P)H-flavin reductase
VPGFSHEYIAYMQGGTYRASFRPLNDAIAAGRLRGVAAIVGCNNPNQTQDKAHIDVISELLKTEDEMDQLRAQAKQLPKEERIPYLRQSTAVLEAQVRLMADRMKRLQSLQQAYEERLTRLRRRLRELESASNTDEEIS